MEGNFTIALPPVPAGFSGAPLITSSKCTVLPFYFLHIAVSKRISVKKAIKIPFTHFQGKRYAVNSDILDDIIDNHLQIYRFLVLAPP